MTDFDASASLPFYDDAEAVGTYLAHRHADVRSPNIVMEEPAFAAEVGELAGLRILDLGCGDGTFAATCALQGCSSFVGVDGSKEMLRRATDLAGGPAVSFVLDRIETYETPAEAFDLVTSRMALHYVDDLAPVFAAVRRALVPGGRFVASVIHPVITSGNDAPDGPRQTQVVDNYFSPGPRSRLWFGRPVQWYHRTIEQYLTLIDQAGLSLTRLRECEPVAELFAGNQAEYDRRRRVPVFLLLNATRAR
jgi:SAM-dependent methyltransferase